MEGNKCGNVLWHSYWRAHPHADPHLEKKYMYNNSYNCHKNSHKKGTYIYNSEGFALFVIFLLIDLYFNVCHDRFCERTDKGPIFI